MVVLGISDNHDAAAALVVDGELVAAASQERFDRVKNSGVFPAAATRACLAYAGNPTVDAVVIGSGFTPPWFIRLLRADQASPSPGRGQLNSLLHGYIVYQSVLQRIGALSLEAKPARFALRRDLSKLGVRAPVTFMDHHRAHAESAYRTQSNPNVLVLTTDAMGDGLTATVSLGDAAGLRRQSAQSGFASVNVFYGRITEHLGFVPLRHEGKVTGLAAHAVPPDALLDLLRQMLWLDGERFSRAAYYLPFDPRPFRALAPFTRAEVAAGAQQVLEEAVVAWVVAQVRRFRCPDIAVAGGLYANVKLNAAIAQHPEVRSLWVCPNMGDGGLALGAALATGQVPPRRLADVFVGPDEGYVASGEPVTTEQIVALLVSGAILARFHGRMEFGPRALGNRSILARADRPELTARINAGLVRSDFMPFGPMIRAEDASAFLIGYERAPEAARFMTVCFRVTERFARLAPGVVHVDGTVRPQVVHADEAPTLHAVLTGLGEQTGVPVLINTSFNMHEEPIVRSAAEALVAWERAGFDALWLGERLLLKDP